MSERKHGSWWIVPAAIIGLLFWGWVIYRIWRALA